MLFFIIRNCYKQLYVDIKHRHKENWSIKLQITLTDIRKKIKNLNISITIFKYFFIIQFFKLNHLSKFFYTQKIHTRLSSFIIRFYHTFEERKISVLYKFFQGRRKKSTSPFYEIRLTLILKPDIDD